MPPMKLPPQPGKAIEPAKPACTAIMGNQINDRDRSKTWVSAKGVRYDLGGYHLYFVQVAMGESGFSALSLLAHPEKFDKAKLDQMCAEAVKVVFETRIGPRRKGIAVAQDPVKNAWKLNEESFRADKDLFDAVMIDKFGFEQVQPAVTRTVLEPTVKGIDHRGQAT